MDSRPTTIEKIMHSLNQAQLKQFSGRLRLQGHGTSAPWDIDFEQGMIVWARQTHHRNRRWLRIIQQNCPEFFEKHWPSRLTSIQEQGKLTEEYWELNVLNVFRREGLVTIEQLKSILNSYLLECLISLSNCQSFDEEWQEKSDIPQFLVIPSVQTAVEMTGQWQQQREILSRQYSEELLNQFAFDLAPVITNAEKLKEQVNPFVFNKLSKLLTGQNTFWDISALMQQNWISVACVLLPLVQSGTLELKGTPDRKFPSSNPKVNPASGRSNNASEGRPKKIIACIDDSPVIAKELERILEPQGYEVLPILDPIKGLATLIKAQPCFIFLDLVMPNTNGYEICSFLRKSPQFKELPIVMLTGHDGIVDRLRAKMAGSTDFLGKPPEPTKVIQVVQKYLKASEASPSEIASQVA